MTDDLKETSVVSTKKDENHVDSQLLLIQEDQHAMEQKEHLMEFIQYQENNEALEPINE